MSDRLPCQVCGRPLVPLGGGAHRRHKRPGEHGSYFDYCSGSLYRAARWPVGQELRHHAGDLWRVEKSHGDNCGDYEIRCIAGREQGRTMTVHAEYMHRDGWRAAA
jgi:hypothetical protein